ncbi:MAG: isoleucine--tRNA ligase [Inquilinaceae bacterium]
MTASDSTLAAGKDGTDYRSTVFLPKTDFPMRAGLPKKEPELLARWRESDLYGRLRAQSRGREKFVLHDGPPYANGHLHIGHATNKILKDVIVRSQQMTGRDANYVPGWDCHGLPIEWKIEEKYRAEGRDKDEVPVLQFRQECRQFAAHWVDVQSEEFQRLGVIGDWANPYTTMSLPAEAQIVREVHKFAANGGLYRGLRPVLWSVVEKTALADAEVEYHDHTSNIVWVRFPVATASRPALEGAEIVIWTTTPWTMPGNRAVAYGADLDYAVWRVDAVGDGATARVGDRLVVAVALADAVRQEAGIDSWTAIDRFPGTALAGTVCRHPLAEQGYDHAVPALEADFVTTDQGTGIVHIAPGHGADDFELGLRHHLAVAETVAEDGTFLPHVPLFAGRAVYTPAGGRGDADGAVIDALAGAGRLLARGTLRHSYPHSWRSKAPLIFRATAQWFISMETNGLRQKALDALRQTRFVPASGFNRLNAMIETRPDWCVSRQRTWGVPIAIFYDRKTGEVLRDDAVFKRIADTFEAEGSDAWFNRDAQYFLGNDYQADDYEQVFDIIEVWFESGSTHAFVLEQRPDLAWPASLYLEGSDQHRGWFHSSLLESCGTRGRAPYEAVLTHGFVLDEDGRKMSKSLGNGVEPQDVVGQSGADILRLWVVSSDYSDDVRIGPEILKYQADTYRRLRNTLRYLLGALQGFEADERVEPSAMPELERWVLHRLSEMDGLVRQGIADFDFNTIATALHQFCVSDLSAFYFDVRKDSLYCDRPDDPRRRAVRTVLDRVFDCLTAWLAPILVFTAEEAWLQRMGEDAHSVHERQMPEVPAGWRDEALDTRWQEVRRVRRVVTGALELDRAEKKIGSSLQAHPTVHVSPDLIAALDGVDFADIVIASAATISTEPPPADAFRLEDVPDVAVVTGLAVGDKCQRCWKILPEVGTHADHPGLCDRCTDAVRPR